MKVKKTDGTEVETGSPSKRTETTAVQEVVHTGPVKQAVEESPKEEVKTAPKLGRLIPQLTQKELEAELEYTTVENFIKKHTDNMDANIDAMARVLRLEPREIREMQLELGYNLPDGTI